MSQLFPAIEAFVQLNQMGAGFHQILPQITHLSLLALLYGIMAFLLLDWKIQSYKKEIIAHRVVIPA